MLSVLHIENIAVIEQAEILFEGASFLSSVAEILKRPTPPEKLAGRAGSGST